MKQIELSDRPWRDRGGKRNAGEEERDGKMGRKCGAVHLGIEVVHSGMWC